MPLMITRLLTLLLLATVITGCQRGIRLTQEQEVELGGLFYERSVQFGGGEYSLTPGLNKYIRDLGQRLAQHTNRSDLPYEFTVVNSSTENAVAMPGGKIIITRAMLLEIDNEAQLAFLLAHEIAHADQAHSARSLERAVALEQRRRSFLGGIVGDSDDDIKRKLSGHSQQAELEADKLAMSMMSKAGYNPAEAITFMEKLAKLEKKREEEAKAKGDDEEQEASIYVSHPPTQARIDANRLTANALGRKGRIGKANYLKRIAKLRKGRTAYALLDEAREDYNDYKLKSAAKKISKALGKEKRDPQFHVVRGLIRFRQDNYAHAKINFDRAKARTKNWFVPYLLSGLANEKLGNYAKAKADFKKAKAILSTHAAIRGYRRSEIALINGD